MHVKRFAGFTAFFLILLSTCVQAGPEIQHWTDAKGARVYFVRTQGLPLLDVQVVFDAGSARDGTQFGVAALTSALLDAGAGSWDADTIASRVEGVGALLGTGVSRDTAWLSLRSLTDSHKLDLALATANAILRAPTFAEKDLERKKKQMLVALQRREESPGALANVAFFEALYGDHPYAHPVDGFTDSVKPLARDDVTSFYRRYYVANNAVVVIVGDVDRSQAEAIAGTLLLDLPEGERAPALPDVDAAASGKTERIQFASEQTHVLSGMPLVRRGDPDYVPLYVGNHILGGSGLVSKITEEVREKRGLSYSAYSYLEPMARKGPFTMGLQTRNNRTDEALGVMLKTLADFIEQGPTDKELDDAKKNITGGFVLRIDSNKKLVEYIAMIGFYELPLDYLDWFPKQVETVSREAVADAFKRRIHPDRFQTVLVGGGAKPGEE